MKKGFGNNSQVTQFLLEPDVINRCSEEGGTLVEHFEDTFENQLVTNISSTSFVKLSLDDF